MLSRPPHLVKCRFAYTSCSGWMRRGCRCTALKSSMSGRVETLRPAHLTASAVSDSAHPRNEAFKIGAAMLVDACNIGRGTHALC